MPNVSVTRRYRFSASHRLHSKLLSAEENRETFGKCNNPYGHGHNYILEVTAAGPLDGKTGLLIDTGDLDELVQREILNEFHLSNLNVDIAEFAPMVPTSENVAVVIEERLRRAWPAALARKRVFLHGIRIHETRRNIFEVTSRNSEKAEARAESRREVLASLEN